MLHGRGNSHASAFDAGYLGLDRFLAAAVGQGATPFALASVDGGESYWHAREDGDDAGAMVVDEFLPLLAAHGLDVRRLAFLGWSMGGYGALRLAGRLGRDRVVAATAMSPALWHRFEDTAPGAFDDATDYARSTVFGRQGTLDGIRVRIDCGQEDPFYAASQDYVRGFRARPAGGFQPGSHDVGYWRRMAPCATVRYLDCTRQLDVSDAQGTAVSKRACTRRRTPPPAPRLGSGGGVLTASISQGSDFRRNPCGGGGGI